MMHFGLTGYPLDHSLSPRLHTAALRALGLEGEYSLYPARPLPEGGDLLDKLMARVRSGDLHGLNVTIPHKQSVLSRLDRLAPAAQVVGAANTIYLQEGSLTGDNTDVDGFWADLQRTAYRKPPAHPSVYSRQPSGLVLGAGGSARAVVCALVQANWRVYVAARRSSQAQELCESLQGAAGKILEPLGEGVSRHETSARSQVVPEHRLKTRARGAEVIIPILLDAPSISSLQSTLSLIVNTTPLGMVPQVESSPWPQGVPFPGQAVVYDLVYNPLETALLRSARRAGLLAFSGLGMLVEQAALAFERWTGLAAPREVMRQSVNLSEYPERP